MFDVTHTNTHSREETRCTEGHADRYALNYAPQLKRPPGFLVGASARLLLLALAT